MDSACPSSALIARLLYPVSDARQFSSHDLHSPSRVASLEVLFKCTFRVARHSDQLIVHSGSGEVSPSARAGSIGLGESRDLMGAKARAIAFLGRTE